MKISIFINLVYLQYNLALPNYNTFKNIIDPIKSQVTQTRPIVTHKSHVTQTKPIVTHKSHVTQTKPIIGGNNKIRITSGNSATITYFTDTVFQCSAGQPSGNALAINPLLLGFTETEWINLYKNASPDKIPWCNRQLNLTINGENFLGRIIDTCDPTGNPFPDPKTGKIIGSKCDYNNVIDLYGENGLAFLKKISNGNDFYNGKNITWQLI